MTVRILPAAKARILEIWDYTEKKWGEDQADSYVRGLIEAIADLQSQRRHLRSVQDEALQGVFFFRYRHHYIFFRKLSHGTLGIISVIHEKMDIPSRLREDAGESEKE